MTCSNKMRFSHYFKKLKKDFPINYKKLNKLFGRYRGYFHIGALKLGTTGGGKGLFVKSVIYTPTLVEDLKF